MNDNLGSGNREVSETGRRKAGAAQQLMLEGKFHVEHWRDGNLIGVHDIDNAITVAAKNLLLEVMFRNGTKITSWFIGLVSNDTPTPPSDIPETDTYASHADFAEFTGYDEAGRQQWSPGAAANKSVTNSGSPLTFTISTGVASKGIYGLMVVGGGSAASTKGDTAGGGLLWSGAKFTSTVTVNATDVLKVTYTVNS